MTRPPGSGKTRNAVSKSPATPPSPSKTRLAESDSSPFKAPPRHSRSLSSQKHRRLLFKEHLSRCALDHDASLHFHGTISLLPCDLRGGTDWELGSPVTCLLTNSTVEGSSRKIVIKLFAPSEYGGDTNKHKDRNIRRDSLDPIRDEHQSPWSQDGFANSKKHDYSTTGSKGRYRLVIRYGAGWIPAREYFDKVSFSRPEAQSPRSGKSRSSDILDKRPAALTLPTSDENTIIVRPLFHLYRRLPPELQEMILKTAAGLFPFRHYDLCSDDYGIQAPRKAQHRSAISLSTMFRISKAMNYHLVPHIHHITDFHFGLTGFTNFLWQSGPTKRREVRRLTFHFGRLALLHCIRWLAPDPVFLLIEPPVATNPRNLQYFWRCQIQELVRDLDLLTLTLDIKKIPAEDLSMVVAIMNNAFGSIERIRFVETSEGDESGIGKAVDLDDEGLSMITQSQTWEDMCLGYFQRNKRRSYSCKFELLKLGDDDFRGLTEKQVGFFREPFHVLEAREGFPLTA